MNASKTNWLPILILGLMLGVPAQLMAQSGANAIPIDTDFEQREVIELGQSHQSAEDPYRSAMSSHPMLDGDWIWTSSGDPIFAQGVTALAHAPNMGILLAAGPDYIAISRDSGKTWHQSLAFKQSTSSPDDFYDDMDDSKLDGVKDALSDDEKIKVIRDYVERELETQFTAEYADLLVDEISDDELLSVDNMQDIESLSLLELNFDTDLSHLFANQALEGLPQIGLTTHGAYYERFSQLIAGGADYEQAEAFAAQRNGVWHFAVADHRILAVTSDTLYSSNDGETWSTVLTAPNDGYFLDVDISSNGQVIVVGMSDGLKISEDAGHSWRDMGSDLEGSVFDVALGRAPNSKALYALTTEGWLYASQDLGNTWFDLTPRTNADDVIIQILPSKLPNRLMALSASTIFLSEDLNTWTSIPHTPFENESLVQITSSDPRLESFTVRTERQVYSYDKDWLNQNTALFTRELGAILDTETGTLRALLATPAGLWLGLASEKAVDVSSRYDALRELWQKEPSDAIIIKHALRAHYLDNTNTSWAMRARLSWLLPRLVFDYRYSQSRVNRNDDRTNLGTGVYLSQQYYSRREKRNEWQIMGFWDIDFASKDAIDMRALKLSTNQSILRLNIIDEVELALMTRRQLQMAGLEQGVDTEIEIDRILAIAEVEAQLHYLTGGYYKAALNQR